MVSPEAVVAWEDAYRRYTHVLEVVDRSRRTDPVAVRELISVSRAVASAWRAITTQVGLPWWIAAAAESAAEAFDEQAHLEQVALEYAPLHPTHSEEVRWR